ncbi:receptor-like protein 7 [Camellia sinensis]|uniref:receptor-like protein 7 n=1 Tax=Camellia sinensis TaxID=4442 RepID=UPI0010363769|nr:receptor-like protein 7 [Camellia sinensis]
MASSLSAEQPLCHAHESSALLQFKQTFSIVKSASSDPSSYPKVASWKLQGESGDCCSWDGVECDEDTGHVIGLDLSSSFLHGSINSSSSLFSLVHLQRLNLANNDFDYSHIPTEISHLSELISLNLSSSVFSGQIPLEISKLSKLVSIDLSYNEDSSFGLLKLEKLGLRSPLQNLTNLKVLLLNYVSISSEVLDTLANLTSLTTLVLENCGLRGEFPISIFYLPNLQVLDVGSNRYLTGHLPEFHPSSPLQQLMLFQTSFSGKLPDSIGNLNFLNQLDFSGCYFSGSLPASLGSLPASLGNLTQLNYVSLSSNKFNVGTLQILGKLTELTDLELRDDLYGSIPSVLSNLTQLTYLDLSSNLLSGEITSHITNLTHLISLDLSTNQLRSPIPRSFFELKNLEILDLSFNNLGSLELEIFLMLKNLTSLDLSGFEQHPDILPWYNLLDLDLSYNMLQGPLPIPPLSTGSYRVAYNGLTGELPPLICRLSSLHFLDLSNNNLTGTILPCLSNFSDSLKVNSGMDVECFEQHPDILPWYNLLDLDLSYNMLQGPLPIPPLSTGSYRVAYNGLTGELPPLICRLSSLHFLDLSNNNLTGTILPCLSNFSDSLEVLNLQGNNFQGPIPHSYNRGSKLKMIDLSDNKLQGKVPGSLANCTELEFLDLSNNLIDDAFPLWLGDLTKLQVLILRSNKFYGAIENPKIKLELPNLHIIDLSHNGFTGTMTVGVKAMGTQRTLQTKV